MVAGREGDLGGDVRRLPAPSSQAIAAGVDEDPVEPLLEARRVAQRVPLAPCLDECVVGGVLRFGLVTQDRPGQAIRPVQMLVGQPGEGGGASGPSPATGTGDLPSR